MFLGTAQAQAASAKQHTPEAAQRRRERLDMLRLLGEGLGVGFRI